MPTTHPQAPPVEDTPVYRRLVDELGDLPTQTREAAYEVHRRATRVLDWNRPTAADDAAPAHAADGEAVSLAK